MESSRGLVHTSVFTILHSCAKFTYCRPEAVTAAQEMVEQRQSKKRQKLR